MWQSASLNINQCELCSRKCPGEPARVHHQPKAPPATRQTLTGAPDSIALPLEGGRGGGQGEGLRGGGETTKKDPGWRGVLQLQATKYLHALIMSHCNLCRFFPQHLSTKPQTFPITKKNVILFFHLLSYVPHQYFWHAYRASVCMQSSEK